MGRVLVAVLAAAAVALAAAAPARAGAEWCETDPLLLIQTPAGTLVPVFLLVGAQGLLHLPAAQAASLVATTSTAEATAGGRATRVTVTVTVPNDPFGAGFPARAATSSGPLGSGTGYATAEGVSGAPMTLRFTLPIP